MLRVRTSGMASGDLASLYSLGAAGALSDGQLLERFLARDEPAASEAAFAALLSRHGSLVLAVCRRELADEDEAHDAFQATFLVLASKARTIRKRESVGSWLLGIARRVAARARVESARRRRLLERFAATRPAEAANESPAATIADTLDHAVLLAEVDRLPERFREPVVLHYFEGLSAEAAAQRLGVARGTVLSRLARARVRIKERLEQRGVSYPALLPAAGSSARWLTLDPVPVSLAQETTRAVGSLGLAGAAVEGVVPASAARLSRAVARRLVVARAGVSVALLAVTFAGFSIGLAATAAFGPHDEPQAGQAMRRPGASEGRPTTPAESPNIDGVVAVHGQVLEPDGKPAAGASILLEDRDPRAAQVMGARRVTAAGPDGRFQVRVRRSSLVATTGIPFRWVLAASAPGRGADWVGLDLAAIEKPFTLRLRRDDVPIDGRIVSLEGRPLAGVNVKVKTLLEVPPSVLATIRANGDRLRGEQWGQMRNGLYPPTDGAFVPVRTGPDGRFRLTGLGRDRLIALEIDGGTVEWTSVLVFTASDPGYRPIILPNSGIVKAQIEGPRFERAVAPGRVVEGTVRDRDTGRPINGARLHNGRGQVQTTDAQGRFRFEGMPATGRVHIKSSVEDQPYVASSASFDEAQPMAPIRADITLKRGTWVEGQVTDRARGNGVPAIVGYYARTDNPHLKDFPDAQFFNRVIPHQPEVLTEDDGRYRIAVPPGGGMLTVKAFGGGYAAAAVPEDAYHALFVNPGGFQYHACLPIDVPTDRTLVAPTVTLERTRAQRLAVVDGEGRPVAGTWIYSLHNGGSIGEPLAADELVIHHDKPGTAETVMFVHEGRSLGGYVDVKGDEPDPIRAVLKPTGKVSGRLVDEDGRPRAGAGLTVSYQIRRLGQPIMCLRGEMMSTGDDGRFRITHIVPGVIYTIQVSRPDPQRSTEGYLRAPEWTVKPGESQDWGDVRVQAYEGPAGGF